jgi:hypothetical protein
VKNTAYLETFITIKKYASKGLNTPFTNSEITPNMRNHFILRIIPSLQNF